MVTAIIKQISTSPAKSFYDIDQLELGDQDVTDRAEDISFSRSVLHDVRIAGDEEKKAYLLKFHDPAILDRDLSPYRIHPMQVEVATANLFRLLAPLMCAKTYSVIDEDGIAAYCLIEKKPNFKTIEQLIIEGRLSYSTELLIKMGIAPLLTYHFLLENNDFRLGNMAIQDGRFFAFDFDRALWTYPTCALIREADITLEEGQTFDEPKFDISLRDMQQFPNIKDAEPDQWPTRPTTGDDDLASNACAFSDALQNLQNDPAFIEEKYYCFFKFAIVFNCQHLVENEVAKGISLNTEEFRLTVEHLQHRATQLRFKLIEDEQFKPFHSKIDVWFQQIRRELFAEVGQNANNELALRLSIGQFDALMKEKEELLEEELAEKIEQHRENQQEVHKLSRQRSLSDLSIISNKERTQIYAKEQSKYQCITALGEKLQSIFEKNKHHINALQAQFEQSKNKTHYGVNAKNQHCDLDLYTFSRYLKKALGEAKSEEKDMLNHALQLQPKLKNRLFRNSRFHKDIKKLLKSKEFKKVTQEFKQNPKRYKI